MKNLHFKLRQKIDQRIDLASLLPEKLHGMDHTAIKSLPLRYAAQSITVGDLFSLRGKNTDHLVFENSNSCFDGIATQMGSGSITVYGDTGEQIANGLHGGRVEVIGNTGDWAGCNLCGGELHIHGNAGDYVAAGTIGKTRGMNGGLIQIYGNTGKYTGDRMRRGMLIIHGNTADSCANRMLAGTIIIGGESGENIAYNMHRGSIILLSGNNDMVPASFVDCGRHTLTFLSLLFVQLGTLGKPLKKLHSPGNEARRFVGDLACRGKGEILLLSHNK